MAAAAAAAEPVSSYSHVQPREYDKFLKMNGINLVRYLKSNQFREYKMFKFKNPPLNFEFEFTQRIPEIVTYLELFTNGPFSVFLSKINLNLPDEDIKYLDLTDLDKKYLAIVFFYYDIKPEFLNKTHENYKFVMDFIYMNLDNIQKFQKNIKAVKAVLVPEVTEADDEDFVDIALPDASNAKSLAKYLKYKMKYLQLKNKLKQNK